MKENMSNHRVDLYYSENGKNHRIETALSSTSVQHFIEKHIKKDRYKLVRFQPRNSGLKPLFAKKLSFFDTN